MSVSLEKRIEEVIVKKLEELGRSDLFRTPHVGFSAADDPKFEELKTIIGPWHYLPGDILPGAKSVISFYVPFTAEVAEGPKEAQYASIKWGESYEVINAHFGVMSDAVIELLTAEGYKAEKIPATHTYDPATLQCKWSHRSAAVIAGLGSFGANRLVITEKGSAVRFCTVITDAVLQPSGPYQGPKCMFMEDGSCRLCIDFCPAKALNDGDIDKFVCQRELNLNEARLKETTPFKGSDSCGKCISICPFSYME